MKLIVKMSGQEAHAAIEGGTMLKLIESVIEDHGALKAGAPVEEPPKEVPKKKVSKKSKPAVKGPEPAPAPEPPATVVEPEPEQPVVEAPAAAPVAPAEALSYSIDDLQKAAVALVNKGKMTELQALLTEFNVSAITQLPDDAPTRTAFMNRVEAIGGQA